MIWLLLPAAIGACSTASPDSVLHGPVAPARVVVVSGDGQQADPGDSLEDPVRFQVVDSASRALAGIQVQLVVTIGGGSVPQTVVTTDSDGVAETAWTMGPAGGAQILEARIGGKAFATVSALTCAPDDCYPTEQLASSFSEMSLLDLATFEGSGQTVHPSVARGHGSATGFWLAITPYPGGAAMYENPSIFRSRDARAWNVPRDLANPVELPPNNGYLSDPELVVNSDQQLWLYYRTVQTLTIQNIIMLTRSRDGVHWDPPVTVATAPSHEIVSPAVVRGAPGAPWQMWSVNSGPNGCSASNTVVERRTSADGVNWSPPARTDLAQPGQVIWHIEVKWIAALSQYWALYNTYAKGLSCATDGLYLATSADGTTWTVYPSPVTRAGVIDAFRHIVYRSTMMVDPRATRVTFWISGASYAQSTGYVWRTATVATTVPTLFSTISTPTVTLAVPKDRRNLPPPEPDVGP